MTGSIRHGGWKGYRKSERMVKIMWRAFDDARQLIHPSPFRIKETADVVTVADDVLLGQGPVGAQTRSGKGLDGDSQHLLQVIASVATAIWRMRAKLEGQSSVELPLALRHLPRHVQAAWDVLASGGIEIQDPTGQRYVPGMAVNAITFQTMEGAGADMIHETIKPSVFYKDVLLQRADVIVAGPLEAKDAPTTSGPSVRPTIADDEPMDSTAPDQAFRGDQDKPNARPAGERINAHDANDH